MYLKIYPRKLRKFCLELTYWEEETGSQVSTIGCVSSQSTDDMHIGALLQ
jgi:hypothetical protein